MSNARRVLVVIAMLMLAISLLIRVAMATSRVERWVAIPELAPPPVELAEPELADEPDPYAGWQTWCEPIEPAPCRTSKDCAAAPDGRAQRCVTPWWANRKIPAAERPKVCASPWPGRHEQKWRRARLDTIVAQLCRRPHCNPVELTAFVGVVASRESTWRPWKAHRLNGDLRANRTAWGRLASRYRGNPHYRDRNRWQGLGDKGQNAALYVFLSDPMAPPEILCREVESTDTYLARARIAVSKQADLGLRPTWATVHAALATGDIRPKASAVDRFRPQARKAGIDPDRRVTTRSFGERLGADVASRRLAAEILRARVDARLGSRFVVGG